MLSPVYCIDEVARHFVSATATMMLMATAAAAARNVATATTRRKVSMLLPLLDV
jgi:hypothetical protein